MERSHKGRTAINRAFLKACHAVGIHIACHGWQATHKRIQYGCHRGRLYVQKGTPAQRTTQKGRQDDAANLCPFKFHIFWRPKLDRWVLVGGSGSNEHRGHPQMTSEEVFLSTKAMSDADRKLVSELFDVRISSGAVRTVLQKHSATLFSCGQISSLRPKPVALSPEEAKMTAAQRLNSNLENDPVISYVKLTDIDTPLVTVKRSVLNRVIPHRVNQFSNKHQDGFNR
jgi:hypothetical protein